MLFLTGTLVVLFSSVLWAAEGIISKAPDSSGIYCNLKFPAIKEDTLTSNRPQLKDPSEGDIVDFYGPCDHDPLGERGSSTAKRGYSARKAPTVWRPVSEQIEAGSGRGQQPFSGCLMT